MKRAWRQHDVPPGMTTDTWMRMCDAAGWFCVGVLALAALGVIWRGGQGLGWW